jgi:chemotaxis protein methyltransferase CheR
MDAHMTDRPALDDIEVRLLLEGIFLRYHQDFRGYSLPSIKRRLATARVSLGYATLSAMQEAVLHDPKVFAALLQFLSVQASDMFRDPSFYLALRSEIVPVLRTYPSLKIWIAGCSGGEEVYSFAILLREEELLDRAILYATDINPEALRRAEAGIYPLERMPAFTENHRLAGGRGSLSSHYTARYGAAALDRALRKQVVFSDHSLATDSVFAEVHLVSCRNVLIYFDRALQDRAIDLMRDSLVRRGFLGLGARESLRLSPHEPEFREVVPGARWYQRC